MGYGERTSFLAGLAMGQISELSFVFTAIGVNAKIVDPSIMSLVALVGLITISVSAYAILYNHRIYEWLRLKGLLRFVKAGRHEEDRDEVSPLQNHIIIVGMNALGRRLAADLHERGHTVLAIDTDTRKLQGLPCRTMQGNIEYPMVMDEAAVPQAKLLISALQIEDTNNLLAYHGRRLGIPTAIHAFDRSVLADLKSLGVNCIIEPKVVGSVQLATDLQASGVIAP
jgi:hypothetical protein